MKWFIADPIEVTCSIEIECSPASFHAHAIPQGIDIRPGDRVLVRGVPENVELGQSISLHAQATIWRAGWVRRQWTQMSALLDLTDLYEVGFESHT